MANRFAILGIIIVAIIVIVFAVPMPISIEYCNADFLDNTLYELQTKCWMDFSSLR